MAQLTTQTGRRGRSRFSVTLSESPWGSYFWRQAMDEGACGLNLTGRQAGRGASSLSGDIVRYDMVEPIELALVLEAPSSLLFAIDTFISCLSGWSDGGRKMFSRWLLATTSSGGVNSSRIALSDDGTMGLITRMPFVWVTWTNIWH